MPSTISVLQNDRDRDEVILGDSGQYVVKLDLVHCAGKNFMTVHYRINLRRNDALVISQSQVASSESDKEIRKRRVIEVSMRFCFAWHKPRNGN